MDKQEMEYRKEQRKFEAMNKPKMVYPSEHASIDSHEENMVSQLIRFYFKQGNAATERLLERLDEFREDMHTRISKATQTQGE